MENVAAQEEVNAAIKAVDLVLPTLSKSPHVDEFQIELGVDANGREAAFITVIVDDDPSGNPYGWPQLRPIHDLIWKEFTERGLNRWPHIEFRLKSEFGTDSDDADATSGEQ
jgi:hypothetical protein